MKKIMFSDRYYLTQAVLEGQKTMTRRMITCPEEVKGNPVKGFRLTGSQDIRLSVEISVYDEDCDDFMPMYIQPRYAVGEVVAIAQSYRDVAQGGYPVDSRYDAFRTANWGDGEDGVLKSSAGWSNKMFVSAGLMPHHIRITDIKIERLNDISDEDCIKEGIYKGQCGSADTHFMAAYYFKGNKQPYCTPREAYAILIDSISGKGTWESNPYVFAYEFELVD